MARTLNGLLQNMRTEEKSPSLFDIMGRIRKRRTAEPSVVDDAKREDRFGDRALILKYFTVSILQNLGIMINGRPSIEVFKNNKEVDFFTNRFTAHLISGVFPQSADPADSLDGKRHKIDVELLQFLYATFPKKVINGEGLDVRVHEIDWVARSIYLLFTADLRESGLLPWLVEDFLTTLKGGPQDRTGGFIDRELKQTAVARLLKI